MTLACDNVHFEIINCLAVNGADVNAKEYLNIAATTNLDIVTMLMDNGADVNSYRSIISLYLSKKIFDLHFM